MYIKLSPMNISAKVHALDTKYAEIDQKMAQIAKIA